VDTAPTLGPRKKLRKPRASAQSDGVSAPTAARKGPAEISPLLGLLLLFGLAVLAIPYAVVAGACLLVREQRLFRRLKGRGRTIAWRELAVRLSAGEGTLIIEQAQKECCRLWWTADDVPSLAPFPPPAFDELDFLGLEPPQPFVAWCFHRYLSPTNGSALLCRPRGLKFPAGFVSPAFFAADFPAARIVATVLLRRAPDYEA
jgi:hypothetical protein